MNLIEPVLYVDLQAVPTAAVCEICGGERYAPGFHCLRCERREPCPLPN